MIHCLEFPAGTWYSGSCPNTTCTKGNATSNPPILGNESQCSCGIGCAPSACFNPSREVVFKAFNDQAQELVPFVANGTIAGIFFGTEVTVIVNHHVDEPIERCCICEGARLFTTAAMLTRSKCFLGAAAADCRRRDLVHL